MRPEIAGADLEVVGEVSDVAEIRDDVQPDVVLLLDARSLDEISDVWQERRMPALVVMTDDVRHAATIARLGAPGWAIVAPDSAGSEVSAAVVAAAHGFALQPAAAERAEEDAEDRAPIEALTSRERDVLELLSEGMPNKAIASRLAISEHTVKFHLSSIFGKLGVSSRTEAVRRGVRAGLIRL